MKNFNISLLKCSLNERGQGIVEYALVLAVVTVIAVGINAGDIDQKVMSVINDVVGLYNGVEN